MQVMLQTTICDGLAFDPFAFEEDGLGPPEVDVSRSEIAEALRVLGAGVRVRLRKVCLYFTASLGVV